MLYCTISGVATLNEVPKNLVGTFSNEVLLRKGRKTEIYGKHKSVDPFLLFLHEFISSSRVFTADRSSKFSFSQINFFKNIISGGLHAYPARLQVRDGESSHGPTYILGVD